MRKTKLQSLFKKAYDTSITSQGTYEEWKKAIYKFGIECYIKVLNDKLVEIDYQGRERYINSEN